MTAPAFKYGFGKDDYIVGFSMFTTVVGVGIMSLPGTLSQAGPLYAILIFIFATLANLYAILCVTKLMLAAPSSVHTLGDIGEWSMGKFGRFMFTSTQLVMCELIPCAYLAMGSILLDGIFPNTLQPIYWMLLMTAVLLPIILQPSLREAMWASVVGALSVLCAIFISLGFVMATLADKSSHIVPPQPNILGVINTYGSMSLAYGATIVIPTLQRIHREPSRMAYVVTVTTCIIDGLFLFVAVCGYYMIGCQMEQSLLFGLSLDAYGIKTPSWVVITAFLSMQVHITMAFGIILFPAFFIIERSILGNALGDMSIIEYDEHGAEVVIKTPLIKRRHQRDGHHPPSSLKTALLKASSFHTTSSMPTFGRGALAEESNYPADFSPVGNEGDDVVGSEISLPVEVVSPISEVPSPSALQKSTTSFKIKRTCLRLVNAALIIVVAYILVDKIMALLDFIGAFASSINSVILPVAFYIKVKWHEAHIAEKVWALTVIILATIASAYCTYANFVVMISPHASNAVPYPLCPNIADYQTVFYTDHM